MAGCNLETAAEKTREFQLCWATVAPPPSLPPVPDLDPDDHQTWFYDRWQFVRVAFDVGAFAQRLGCR